jgi:NAD(P)-dependent dehydrogenase (short-subunit alcohol dehydrogenase family)
MSDKRPAVLVIGGSGVFGSHLCRRLARLGLYRIYVGGRSAKNAAGLLGELMAIDPQCAAEFVEVDRARLGSERMVQLEVFAVVDAAGPFQDCSYTVVNAAIAAGVHYIDLSDARAFVKGIDDFGGDAKAAGIAVLTGASSTPAISNAMIRHMVTDWKSIDRILVAILPGNHAPRGRSVMAAILSWVGEPVRVFDDGRWQSQSGWSGARKIGLGTLGQRNAALAETPDLDVLVDDFRPRVSGRFYAGLELGIMHHGLRIAGALRRWRLLPRLDWLTGLFLQLSRPLGVLGSDTGGMVVEVSGVGADGISTFAKSRIVAKSGDGPIIPSLAAVAILQRLALGKLAFRGADHAGHHVNIEEIMSLVTDLDIHLESDAPQHNKALFRAVLGDAEFAGMPKTTRALHRGAPAVMASGFADIGPADNAVGRFVSWLFRFPKPGKNVPLDVLIEQTEEGERWERRYPDRVMKSVMSKANAEDRTLEERFGPISFRMKISGHRDGLDMQMLSARTGKLTLPKFMVPEVIATERVDGQGHHLFDVSIGLPVIGRIVHYKGWLSLGD